MTALFGPSGCGKTTVLRCIAGLHASATDFATIDGEIWQDENGAFLPTHKRPLGYVFQEASLFPHLSVRRNLLFGAPRKDGGKAKDAIAFDEVVELLGLERLLDRSPAQSLGRRAPARRDRPRASVAAEASADGRAALGARPGDQERDPAVPRAAARPPRLCRSSTSPTTWPRSNVSPTRSC